jgi:serine/threonine protein kinase
MKMVNLCLMDRNEIKETMREENVLSKLDSPYIVKYYESFMNDDSLCIITEYCDGGDLDQRLRRMKRDKARFPEERIVYWLAQIASAAYYLHSRKILHRNIKPGYRAVLLRLLVLEGFVV